MAKHAAEDLREERGVTWVRAYHPDLEASETEFPVESFEEYWSGKGWKAGVPSDRSKASGSNTMGQSTDADAGGRS